MRARITWRPGSAFLLAAAVFLASFAVYSATAARSLVWGDSAEFVSVAHTLGIAHPPGYPLYTLLGALAVRFPFGTPFLRMSLLSGLFAAAAAAVAALVVWTVTAAATFTGGGRDGRAGSRSRPSRPARALGALLAGLTVAFGPTFWSQAVVPEVYSLNALLLLAVTLLAAMWLRDAAEDVEGGGARGDRSVPLIGLALGLGLAHHLTAVFIVPSVLFVLLRGRPRRLSVRSALAAGLLLTAGLSLYAYLPLRSAHDPPILWAPLDSMGQVLAHIRGAQYAPRLFTTPGLEVGHKLLAFVSGLPGEVGWPVLALAAVGWVALFWRASSFAVAISLWPALVLAHATVYRIPDIGSYYVPVYAAVAVAAGCGLVALASRGHGGRTRVAAAWAAAGLAVAAPTALLHANWRAADMSGCSGGRVYLRRVVDSIRPGGVVLTMTDRLLFPLWYARFVEGERDDFAVLCLREHAPHLQRWYPDVRFPTEDELCSLLEGWSSPGSVSARESVPIGNYLPLLVSLNVADRPVYADPDLGRRVFPDRTIPRGVLVEIAPASLDAPDPVDEAADAEFWENVFSDLESGEGTDDRTAEVYAKTLAEHGMLLIEKGAIPAAIEALERARELAPRVPLCRNNLGVAYERAGRLDESRKEFEAALALAPALAAPHYNVYRLARSTGDEESAWSELRAAVKLAPHNPSYRIELGRLLEERGEFPRAEEMFREAVALSEDDWGASLAYGGFLARRRRFSEAVAAYRNAEELRPDSAGALRGLGRCYWALDDREQALEVMERLVELQPHNPQPKYDLALMLYRSGRARRAVSLLDDVIRILPNMWEARALKASILGDLGRYWEARALFEQAQDLGASGDGFWRTWISMERASGDTVREARVRQQAAAGDSGSAARTVAE